MRSSAASQDTVEEQALYVQKMDTQHHDDGSKSALLQQKMENCEASFGQKWASSPWRVTLIILTLPLALSVIVTLAAAAEMASQSYIMGRDCYPNGLWKEAPGATWRIMDSSYFFTPNLSFGAFTFTQVKVIDIAWDLIIGRGGQLLLAWVNYRVFNEWLVYHMEMHFTSYKLYAAVAFETTTMGTLGVLAKEFLAFGKKSWSRLFRWLAILSMLLSTFYVLAFPTLMAAMTGYITTYETYVENYEHSLIEWYKVRGVSYIIHDASRLDKLGYSDDLVVTENDRDLEEAVDLYIKQFEGRADGTPRFIENGFGYSELSNISTPSEFIIKTSSGSTTVRLESPSLNITTFAQNWRYKLPPPATRNQFAFALEDRPTDIYNTWYLLEHGSCKPNETYQWGFSYIFLFMVSIFNFIWTCIMAGMWLDTRRGSRMYKSGRRPGLLRSIMDYSAAIRQELGPDAEYLDEEELRKRLRRSGGALVVPREELKISRADTGESKVRARNWRRKLTRGSTF